MLYKEEKLYKLIAEIVKRTRGIAPAIERKKEREEKEREREREHVVKKESKNEASSK